MGIYYNPEEVKSHGQPVDWRKGIQPKIPEGKRLIAVMNRRLYRAAPDVTDRHEFKHFHNLYAKGEFRSMDLYLIDEGQLEPQRGDGQ